MKMEPENEKYLKVVDILRKSKPVLSSTEDIERAVMGRISGDKQPKLNLSELIDFLFGWVYIGWVRRSLILASVVLVVVFIYQQGVILREIDYLSRQPVSNDRGSASVYPDDAGKMLMVYRNTGRRFYPGKSTMSEKEIQELIESIDELKTKYKDLENIIEQDPELKKLIDQKLKEYNLNRQKL